MRRNISYIICFLVVAAVLSIGVSAKAQINFQNTSFEDGILNPWSHTAGRDVSVIDSQGITPNVTPTDGNYMVFSVGSPTPPFVGSPYTGGNGFPDLATDQLINTGMLETNNSTTQQVMNINETLTEDTIVTYDISFLAPTNNNCDNYAAVLLIQYSGPDSIVDAKCYNSTGNGFINTVNGPVSCIQVADNNVPHSVMIGPRNYQFGGNSGFFTDTLTMDIIDGLYALQFVTGQIDDGVCNQANGDVGILIDNFNFLTLNLNPLNPSQAGAQNTLSGDGFTPGGDVTLIYSFNVNGQAQASAAADASLSSEVGTRVAPDTICQGLDTPLVNPRILTTVQANGNGDVTHSFPIPNAANGVTVHIQAVDLSSCAGSNINTEVIGNPQNGEPPVLLPLNPGTAGQQNTLSATDATPNDNLRFIWGFNQGNTTANNVCPGFQSGIINPRLLSTVNTDGNGDANLNVNVPANAAGVNIVIQAVDLATCTGSNVRTETL